MHIVYRWLSSSVFRAIGLYESASAVNGRRHPKSDSHVGRLHNQTNRTEILIYVHYGLSHLGPIVEELVNKASCAKKADCSSIYI
jgi:hypothetical protein